MEKIWLRSYQPGVPAEIGLDEHQSLGELFERSVARFRDRPAFVCMGAQLTYGELDRLSRDFACYLQNTLALPPGTRIALMMPNILQYPVCLFGALRAGYVVVNCNPLYTARELEHQLKDSGAEAIVVLENFAHTLAQVMARVDVKHVVIARMGDLLGFPKGAVVNFTRSLAGEWGRHGITVNALAPGFFPSKMTRGTLEAVGAERLAAMAPLGRIGDDDDLKGAAVLFASAAGKHITGQILAVDGGVSAVHGE